MLKIPFILQKAKTTILTCNYDNILTFSTMPTMQCSHGLKPFPLSVHYALKGNQNGAFGNTNPKAIPTSRG